MTTKIEWATETWNPFVGCSRMSDGCKHCYAERMARRLATMPQSKTKYQRAIHNGRWSAEVRVDRATLESIPHKAGSRVFVNSMSDTFHDGFSDSDRVRLFRAMVDHPETTYLILTKRAEKMKEFCDNHITQNAHNIWMGVTVEDQSTATRILYLPADTGRCWLSAEPLIGPVEIPETDRLQWVVVGCETGPGRRPCWLKWVQEIIEQCDAARVPVFVKKMELFDGITGDVAKFPVWARRREWPHHPENRY